MLIAFVLAAGLVWAAIIYVGYRRVGAAGHKAMESELKFQLASAPWSDTYVASLLAKHPNSPAVLFQYLTNAVEKHDWPEALHRIELFIRRAPADPKVCLMQIDALRNMGRTQEADAVLRRARWRFWSNPHVALAWARQAVQQEAWQQADRRYAKVRRRFPNRGEGFTEAANVLVQLGQLDKAEAMIHAALLKQPNSWGLLRSAATLAEQAGRTDEAIKLWSEMRYRFPEEPTGSVRGIAALRQAGRPAEADELERKTRDFFPGHPMVVRALGPAAAAPAHHPDPAGPAC